MQKHQGLRRTAVLGAMGSVAAGSQTTTVAKAAQTAMKKKPKFDFTPERHENESFEDYKARQRLNTILKRRLKGRGILRWDSMKQGTFCRYIGHKLLGE